MILLPGTTYAREDDLKSNDANSIYSEGKDNSIVKIISTELRREGDRCQYHQLIRQSK